MYGQMHIKLGRPKYNSLKIWFDSGSKSSILLGSKAKNLRKKTIAPIQWLTQAGVFETKYKSKVEFILPELDETKIVEWDFHVDVSRSNNRYDMILGRDIMSALDLDVCFQTTQ